MENSEIQSRQFAYSELMSGSEVELIAKLRREGRASAASEFRHAYKYGSGTEGKTCIWPGGVYSWSEKSSGIMWVGVHGKNSICVVTKAGDLDVTRVRNSLIFNTKEQVLQRFRRAVISEIEDIADPSSKLRAMLDPTIETPFGVVSVIPGSDNKVYKESVYETYGYKEDRYWKLRSKELNIGQTSSDEDENDEYDKVFKDMLEKEKIRRQEPAVFSLPPPPGYDKTKTIMFLLKNMKTGTTNETIQASSSDYDEKKAICFLLERMKNMKAFSVDETIQIAISAFQHLFKKKFKANEIEVSVMDPDYFVPCVEAYYKDIYVKHLETIEIEQHLSVVN